MVDGLKPGQRKVIFTCLKRNLTKKEIKVAQLSGSVAEVRMIKGRLPVSDPDPIFYLCDNPVPYPDPD